MSLTVPTHTPQPDNLKEAQDALDEAVQPDEPGRAGKLEQQLIDSVNSAEQTSSSSEGLGILMHGVESLVESLPPLVRALDAVAQIHPFLAVAVGAFKVVVELEAKRRDNDKKVTLLFLEMRNMMAALLQLQGVRTDHVGRDGLTVGARLAELVQKTAREIKECANACDAYARKRLLVKVIKAPSWDGRLREYVQLFADRKGEFGFAIAVHTGVGIDSANDKLDALITKVDVVIAFFEKTAPREQRALADAVSRAGGAQAVLGKPDVLQQLLRKEQQLEGAAEDGRPGYSGEPGPSARRWNPAPAGQAPYYYSRAAEEQRVRRRWDGARRWGEEYGGAPGGWAYGYREAGAGAERTGGFPGRDGWAAEGEGGEENRELGRLLRDLADEPAVAIRRNLVQFARKFAIQQRAMVREVTRVVVHEGDRVISEVLAGPHERILDPDLYNIWKDMRWRGIVKARHLVLAILDHYTQQLDDQQRAAAQGSLSEDDAWALGCLDLMHIQPLVEAFDADASGFVTVQEVNRFTTARPQGWSLLKWLAYWTVGWRAAMAEYRSKIDALLTRMNSLRAAVRGRGPAMQRYLEEVVPAVKAMTRPFREDAAPRGFLLDRFRGYVEQEEARVREGLETAKYDLDALDTLALINGPRGLERNLFVILYLLLRRHHDVMVVGKRVILHPEELVDAAGAILLVKDAFDFRIQELTGLFTQRRLSVSLELSDFACGMLSAPYLIMPDYGAQADDLDDVEVDDSGEGPSETMLKYPPHLEEFYPENEDGVESEGTDVVDELKPLLGHWSGVQTSESEVDGMISRKVFSLDFRISPSDSNQVVAVPLLSAPWVCTRTTVTGTFTGFGEDGQPTYVLATTYNASTLEDEVSRVALSEDGQTLTGELDSVVSLSTPGPGPKTRVVLKKGASSDVMLFYPLLSEFADNKSKAAARWRFATAAVLHAVRRCHLSWGVLRERRERKRRLASLLLRASSGALHPDDAKERARLEGEATPADLHYFAWASVERARFAWVCPACQVCGRVLRAGRPSLWCAVCKGEGEGRRGVVMCEREECLRGHLSADEYAEHRILKTREEGWTVEKLGEGGGMDEERLMGVYGQRVAAVEGEWDLGMGNEWRPPPLEGGAESERGRQTVRPLVAELADLHVDTHGSTGMRDVPPFGRGSPSPNAGASMPVKDSAGPEPTGVETSRAMPAPKPRCIGCSEDVTLPCWTCMECSEPIYICTGCDERAEGGISPVEHEARHVLLKLFGSVVTIIPPPSPINVRYRSRSPGVRGGEARISAIEERLGTIEGRCGRIEERMEGFERQMAGVDGRLARIDDMLAAVLSLLRREPDGPPTS